MYLKEVMSYVDFHTAKANIGSGKSVVGEDRKLYKKFSKVAQ